MNAITTTTYPVDSTTRPCCQGIGNHAQGCTRSTNFDVPLPAGAERVENKWRSSPRLRVGSGETRYRYFASKQFPVFGGVTVDTGGAQFVQQDGAEHIVRDVRIVSTWAGGMHESQARQLAQAVIEAADYVAELEITDKTAKRWPPYSLMKYAPGEDCSGQRCDTAV